MRYFCKDFDIIYDLNLNGQNLYSINLKKGLIKVGNIKNILLFKYR